jgi:hypothetical protein
VGVFRLPRAVQISGPMTELSVSDEVVLSPVRPDDRAALVDHLQAREIWRNTLYIPRPYT